MRQSEVDPAALGRRVARRRIKLGLSQDALAARIGMKQQGVDAIEQGRVRRPRLLHELAEALGTTGEWLLWRRGAEERTGGPERVPPGEEFTGEADGDASRPDSDAPFEAAVPQMSGRIGGGSTSTPVAYEASEMQTREEVAEWWRIPQAVLRGLARADAARTVAFVMDGDSMEPTIRRTDVVFIDTSQQMIRPDGIWAIDYGLGRTLKRIATERVNGEMRYVLKSDNALYSDQVVAAEELVVFGRYVGRFSVF